MTSMPTCVTLASTATRSDQVLVQELGGEAVLLDLASEQYFGLDLVGTRIWLLLGESGSLMSVHAKLCEEFEAEPIRIEQDLLTLIGQLQKAGLVTVA